MDRNRLLTIGAVFAAVVVIALGFIAGVRPQLSAAADAKAQNSAVVAQNQGLRAGITTLESKFSKMKSLTTQLADLQQSVPADAAAPEFIDEMNALADQANVGISSFAMSDAQAYTAPVAASTSSTATTTPGTAPVAPAAVTNSSITASNFSVIPFTITVSGTYGEALDFLSAVHSGDRLFLVTAFSGGSDSSADGTTGSWTLTGSIYALTDAQSAQKQQQTTTNSSTASSATDGSSTDTAAGK